MRIGQYPVGSGSLDGNEIFQMRMLQLDSDILARPPVSGSVNLGELEIIGPVSAGSSSRIDRTPGVKQD